MSFLHTRPGGVDLLFRLVTRRAETRGPVSG